MREENPMTPSPDSCLIAQLVDGTKDNKFQIYQDHNWETQMHDTQCILEDAVGTKTDEDFAILRDLNKTAETSESAPALLTYTVPITMLPYEILGEIFLLVCVPPIIPQYYHECQVKVRYTQTEYVNPMYLAHICSHLRGAAFSTPALWTYINIFPKLIITIKHGNGDGDSELPLELWNRNQFWEYTDNDYFPKWRSEDTCAPVAPDGTGPQLLNEWLERSKKLPLTIVCRREGRQPSHFQWNRFTAGIFMALAKAAHRWAHVDMFVPHICARLLNAECGKRLDMLHTASLCAVGPVINREIIASKDINAAFLLRSAPNLRKLQLVFFYSILPVDEPLNRLVDLRIEDSDTDSVLNLLMNTPYLRELYLANVISTIGENLEDMVVDLDYLRSLRIVECSTSAILKHLDFTPLLEVFDITEIYGVKLDILNISLFLRRSGCKLRTLKLNTTVIHSSSLYQVMPFTQALTTLVVALPERVGADSLGTTLGRLLCLDFEINVPYLEHLEFHVMGMPCMRVIEAVKQRWQHGQLNITADSGMQRPDWLEGTGLVAKITFVGFRWESSELSCIIKEHFKDEMEEGLSVMFNDWYTLWDMRVKL